MNNSSKSWSKFQLDIFAEVAEGAGHVVVEAVPGSGKTTTIEESLARCPRGARVAAFAFGKEIATELQRRITERGLTNAFASTTHSFGFASVRSAIKLPKGQGMINKWKVSDIVAALYGVAQDREGLAKTAESRELCVKLVSLSKAHLADSLEAIEDVADLHGLDLNGDRAKIVGVAFQVLGICKDTKRISVEGIDFDDMVWLPVVLNLNVVKYDIVFIDETQDLNKAQVELALRACKAGGRIFAVGDRNQAIFGFRGADSNSIANIIERFGAKVMPLSVSYRCASNIVAEAAEVFNGIEAAPGADAGIVARVSDKAMKQGVRPGDFVLSRANAPLVSLCLGLLADGIKARIQGRDVGGRLLKLIAKSRADSVENLIEWANAWATREIARLEKKRASEAAIQGVDDTRDCLLALCDGTATLVNVRERAENLFTDMHDGNSITLSSTHKAKGLERERVWLLSDTYNKRPTMEERCIYYVAITRAQKELYFVAKPKGSGNGGEY